MRGVAVLIACLAIAGCASAPPAETPAPPKPATAALSSPAPSTVPREPVCPPCVDQSREIARLRQELASREAELRDLRSSQREQIRVLQESTRDVTRARVRLRRLATQADAASYIAEVEVALRSALASSTAQANAALLSLAQGLLASADVPFAKGEYGAAIDRAAQAEELVAVLGDQAHSPTRRAVETSLMTPLSLKLAVDAKLRTQPLAKSRVITAMSKDAAVTAYAFKGTWMQVKSAEGRFGWVEQAALATP